MEWVSTTGRMGQYIMENLKRDLSMEKGNGENSKMLKIAISMKVNIGVIGRMDMEFSNGKVETFIRVTTEMMREMAMERWFGLMVLAIKVNGREVFNMDKEKWCFLMGQSKKEYLKIIFSLETLSKTLQLFKEFVEVQI